MRLAESTPVTDESALGEAVQRLLPGPRLLGIGEAMHGEETFLRVRNTLFRYLVEHAHYRSIAIESSCLRGRVVDAAVQAGTADLDEVMRTGFSHRFGGSPANRDLVAWMSRYNRDRPPGDQVRFLGFDSPTEMSHADSPRECIEVVHRYLERHADPLDLPCTWDRISSLIGDDSRWTDRRATRDPSRSIGGSPAVRDLRIIVDDLRRTLSTEAPRLVARTSGDELWDAQLCARTAAGLLAYHATVADDTPRRVARLLSIRDGMMADNLVALAEREAGRGPALVFAHNQHLHKAPSRWRPGKQDLHWHCAGALLATRLGDAYAVIGTAAGAMSHQGVPEPDPSTVEGHMRALGPGAHLLATGALTGSLAGARARQDVSDNRTYSPISPQALVAYDAILFLGDIDAAQPRWGS
jgi:erythromycin esterase